MRTAFVAGATGYTGREVVRQLCAAGVKAIAHVRPDSPSLGLWRTRFEEMGAIVDATSWHAASIEGALRARSPDAVFALLGTTQARARTAAASGRVADYEAVDYGLTHMLIEGAQNRFRSITSERLARALISAARDPNASNRVLRARDLQERAGP